MKRLLSALFLLSTFCLSAQRIISFNAFESKGSVLLKFILSPGPECFGYIIHRSTDSITYSPVYQSDQTCGNASTNAEISWTDGAPVPNVINYYRVELKPYEVSRIERIYVGSASFRGIIAYPNPLGDVNLDEISLRILNTNGSRFIGFVYNQDGDPVCDIDTIAAGEIVRVDITMLRNGVYCVWLTDGNNAYSAKFIIAK
jgi:hypothetical protein